MQVWDRNGTGSIGGRRCGLVSKLRRRDEGIFFKTSFEKSAEGDRMRSIDVGQLPRKPFSAPAQPEPPKPAAPATPAMREFGDVNAMPGHLLGRVASYPGS
jgi:hypothetical protein